MTVDFSPIEEERLTQVARDAGLAPAAFVKKVVQGYLPPSDPVAHVRSLLARWRAEDDTPSPPPVTVRPGESPTESLFRAWDEEDADMTDEERQAEETLWRELEASLNEARPALGMRRLT